MTVLPHGGSLTNLVVPPDRAQELRRLSLDLPTVVLNRRQACDLELLMSGAFSPLTGYLDRTDYDVVLNSGRLANGTLWPIPINLAISPSAADGLVPGMQVALRDPEGFMPAVLNIEDVWQPDRVVEAKAVYGTLSPSHPGVRVLIEGADRVYLGGQVEGIQLPVHFDFEDLWHTPEALRNVFLERGWHKVIAFQTSRPIHRLQRDLMLELLEDQHSNVLLHPVTGVSKPGDLEYYARVHCYEAVLQHLPLERTMLSLLPLAMRMAGPREALWHGIIHKNYGCSAFVVGPHDSSPPEGAGSEDFYGKYDAQEYVSEFSEELGIELLAVEERHYSASQGAFVPVSTNPAGEVDSNRFSDADLPQALSRGEQVPDWFSFPEVINCLRRVHPSHNETGFTLFFTGLSGSGKSTLARIIQAKLIENGQRPVTLLDGDIVRHNLSSELGFSKDHRDLNIRRIGFVANEISKNGGVAICAPIAPYRDIRRDIRSLIEQHGAFIEIHISTPLSVCESRDRKGLYAKARQGLVPHFTGISDPYETPEHAELIIDTTDVEPAVAARHILDYLTRKEFIADRAG